MNVMNRVIVRRSFLLQRNAFALKNVQSLILQNNMNNTVLTLNSKQPKETKKNWKNQWFSILDFNHNVKFAHSKVPRGGGKQKKGKGSHFFFFCFAIVSFLNFFKAKALTGDEPESDFDSSKLISVAEQ